MREWNFAKIDEALLAAAIDPGQWPKALECLSLETGSRCSLLRPPGEIDVQDGGGTPSDRGTGPADPDKAASGARSQVICEDNAPQASTARTAEIKVDAGNAIWRLSVHPEARRDRPFSAREQENLAQLSQSLSRAAMIAQAMDRASASAALEAFDISNIAVVLVNRAGNVVGTNKAAGAILKSGIKIVDGRLNLADKEAMEELDEALHQLFSTKSKAAILPPVRLPRRGKPPVIAHPLKLAKVSSSTSTEPQAAIILVDPGARKKSSESSLHVAFQLTPAEARLASALTTGEPLDQICEQLEISKETGRNQLKNIFAKTGTRRQAELVLVMAKLL